MMCSGFSKYNLSFAQVICMLFERGTAIMLNCELLRDRVSYHPLEINKRESLQVGPGVLNFENVL